LFARAADGLPHFFFCPIPCTFFSGRLLRLGSSLFCRCWGPDPQNRCSRAPCCLSPPSPPIFCSFSSRPFPSFSPYPLLLCKTLFHDFWRFSLVFSVSRAAVQHWRSHDSFRVRPLTFQLWPPSGRSALPQTPILLTLSAAGRSTKQLTRRSCVFFPIFFFRVLLTDS